MSNGDGHIVLTTEVDDSGIEKGKSKILSALGSVGKGVAGVTASFAAAGAAATAAFVKGAKETAAFGDNIDKMSQKIGLSAEAYQKWDYVLGQNGASIDSLQMGLKTLSNAAVNGDEAFSRLGITQQELASLSKEELFEKTIAALQKLPEGTERTALATKLLGRSATELEPLLNSTAESVEELKKQAEEYGMIMSDEAVKSSAAFQDSLDKMQRTLTGVKNNLLASFLPAMTQVTDGLALLFKGDSSGADLIAQGIDGFINKMMDAIPRIADAVLKIVLRVAEMLTAALPGLIKTIVNALPGLITTLVEGVVSLIPVLIDGIVDAALAIVDNLTTIVTPLINAIPKIIIALVNGLMRNLPKLIQGLISLTLQIVAAIPQIIQALIDCLPEVITMILDGIFEAIPQIIEGLAMLVVEIVKSVPVIFGQMVTAVANVFVGIWDSLKKVFSGIGEFFKKYVIDPVVGFFDGMWEAIKNGLKAFVNFFVTIINGILTAIEAFINFFIGGINLLIKGINLLSFEIPDWVPGIGGSKVGFDIPLIKEAKLARVPYLASGAVIPPNKQFLAVLGDQKSGTNVEAPLETIKQAVAEVFSKFAQEMNAAGNQPIVIEVDGRELARAVRNGDEKIGKQTVFGEFSYVY